MFYILRPNVYLVKGNARSCIYDFNLSKLYSINNALAQKIELSSCGEISLETIEADLQEIFEEFYNVGIMELSENTISRSISEISDTDDSCKFAWIEITNRCNLRCRHCYNESAPHHGSVMSLHNFKLAVDRILKLGVPKIQIIGGEPFFEQQLLKPMLDYAVGKFHAIEIFTNGTLITQEWIDYLRKNKIHLALSVYSYEKKTHDEITGCNGSWQKTNQTIAALQNSGIPYRVCNVLMKDAEIGNKCTDLYTLSPDKDVVRMSGRANFSLLSDELIKKRLITKASFQNPISKRFCSMLVSGHNCFRSRFYVSADMIVYPCVMERRFRHCTISNNGDIILKESIRHFNKDCVHECCQCEYRYACFDCRPDSLDENIREKPWYCTYKPLIGEWENEDQFIQKLRLKWENTSDQQC